MAEELTSTRSDRYVNKTVSELQQANRSPIYGYESLEIISLEDAVKKSFHLSIILQSMLMMLNKDAIVSPPS